MTHNCSNNRNKSNINSFVMETVMDWFLYDNGLRHEKVKNHVETINRTFDAFSIKYENIFTSRRF